MMRVRLNSLTRRTFVPKLEHRAAVFASGYLQLTNFLQLCAMRSCTTTPPTLGAPLMPPTATPAAGQGAGGAAGTGSGLRKVVPCGLTQEELHKLLDKCLDANGNPNGWFKNYFYKASDPTLNPDTKVLVKKHNTPDDDIEHRCSTCGCTIAEHARDTTTSLRQQEIPGLFAAVRDSELRTAPLTEGSDEPSLRLVQLSAPFTWMAGNENVLFVRSFYDTVINDVIMKYRLTLILGQPGIGKSYFGCYLLRHFVQKKVTVVYVVLEQLYIFDAVAEKVFVVPRSSFSAMGPWTNIKTVIFESYDGQPAPAVQGDVHMIVISSPARAQYKRYFTQCGPYTYVFPCWNDSELHAAAAFHNVTTDELKRRRQFCGPIPRHLFGAEYHVKWNLTMAMKACVRSGAELILNAVHAELVDVGASSALLMVDSKNGRNMTVSFVSPQIKAAVRAIEAMSRNKSIITFAAGLRVLHGAAATGRIVEAFLLYFFTLPEGAFARQIAKKIRYLPRTKDDARTINRRQSRAEALLSGDGQRHARSLEKTETWGPNTILIPDNPRFPLIDAMFFVDQFCFFVQVTRKRDHQPTSISIWNFLRTMEGIVAVDGNEANHNTWMRVLNGSKLIMLFLGMDDEGVTERQELQHSTVGSLPDHAKHFYQSRLGEASANLSRARVVQLVNDEASRFWSKVHQFTAKSTLTDENVLGEVVFKCVADELEQLCKDAPTPAPLSPLPPSSAPS